MEKVIVGNHAVSYGAMLSRVQLVAAYPISPQTTIIEELSELCASGQMKSEYIKVESEHSAMACCIGAASVGVRTFTATSAQGLALMHEELHWAAGARLPIVMVDVNRAMSPPWTMWCDQTDSLSQRDTGWLQFYCESNQEALDTIIQAYKISEEILLPSMVMLDGFILSHTYELVDIPNQETVDRFLPRFQAKYKLDIEDPHSFGGAFLPEIYFEQRYKMQEAMEKASKQIKEQYKKLKTEIGAQYYEGKYLGFPAVFVRTENLKFKQYSVPQPVESSGTKTEAGGGGCFDPDVKLPPQPKIKPSKYIEMCLGIRVNNFIISGNLLSILSTLPSGNTFCHSLTKYQTKIETEKIEGKTYRTTHILPVNSTLAAEGYLNREEAEKILNELFTLLK